MALSSLVAYLRTVFSISAQQSLTGSDLQPNTNTSIINKQLSVGTAAANAAAGGADELVVTTLSIAASGNSSLDLTSLTDILGATGISLARVKIIQVRLLSVTDDSTIGTAASSVTIDNTVANALSAQSHSGWFDNAHEGTAVGGAGDATGSKFTIPNGGVLAFGTPAGAGILVDGTHKVIKVVNNDSGVTAKVQVALSGGTS